MYINEITQAPFHWGASPPKPPLPVGLRLLATPELAVAPPELAVDLEISQKYGISKKKVTEFIEESTKFTPGIRRARALGPGPLGPGQWARAHGRREQVEKKSRKAQFSEWGLPGGQIVGAPRESIFRLSRGSQLPYTSKYAFGRIYYKI